MGVDALIPLMGAGSRSPDSSRSARMPGIAMSRHRRLRDEAMRPALVAQSALRPDRCEGVRIILRATHSSIWRAIHRPSESMGGLWGSLWRYGTDRRSRVIKTKQCGTTRKITTPSAN